MGNLQVEAINRVFVIVSQCWLQRDGAEDSYDAKIMTISSLHRTRSQKGEPKHRMSCQLYCKYPCILTFHMGPGWS